MESIMTGGEILIYCLKKFGIKHIFGIPGSHNLPIYDALYQDTEMQSICACHEGGAAFMADGYARATGQIGVCLTTAGPGVTNASTGVAEAYGDSVPVFLISGEVRKEAVGKEIGAYHEMDLMGFTKPITKWNACANSVRQIPNLVAEGIKNLKTGRPGPVHLAIPVDVLLESEKNDIEITCPEEVPPERKIIDETAFEKAFHLISKSRKPIILVGGGVTSSGAFEELKQTVNLLKAPVIYTQMGKSSFPEDNRFCFGYCRPSDSAALVAGSDCMIALGTRFTDLSTEYWKKFPEEIIQVNIDPSEKDKFKFSGVFVESDIRDFLLFIQNRVGEKTFENASSWLKQTEALKKDRKIRGGSNSNKPFNSDELRQALSADAIVYVDACMPAYAMYSEFKTFAPRTFFGPALFFSLGYALPAALGAKAGFPQRQVVSICGDGGCLMTGMEIATAKKYGLNTISIVVNDGCYSTLKHMQKTQYGNRFIDIDLPKVDFVALAASLGVHGMRVSKKGALKSAVEKAIESNNPCVIEVRV
jgi:acetolactate synthase-1/2/3 large subunit